MFVDVLLDPAYVPYWIVGVWIVLAAGFGTVSGEFINWLIRRIFKCLRKRRKGE